METQKTLDSFIKSRKRPVNEEALAKKGLLDKTVGIIKPSRKLSFDTFASEQIVKKLKVG